MKKTFAALGISLVVIGLYIGLALLGWGVDDIPGFFSHPARLTYVIILLISPALSIFLARTVPQGGIGEKGREDKFSRRQQIIWQYILRPIVILVLAAMPFCDRRNLLVMPEMAVLRYTGLGAYIAGVLLISWTSLELGRQYSVHITLQEGHKLITSGPYRFIRHPRYLGVMIVTLGLSLIFRSWVGVAASPLMLIVLIARLTDEERLLKQEFGQDWEAYTRRSWRLIPYIY